MAHIRCPECSLSRREMLRAGFFGLGVRAAVPAIFGQAALTLSAQEFHGRETHPERVLVVVELAGGNDGLDTVVPYANDDYHRARPTLGSKPMTNSDSIRAWAVCKKSGTTGAWRWCTAAAIPIPTAATSRRWSTGTRRRPMWRRRWAGWASLPMRTGRRGSRTPSSISRRSRAWRCRRRSIRRWCSAGPRSSCGRAMRLRPQPIAS